MNKYINGYYFYKILAYILIISSFMRQAITTEYTIFWCVMGFITFVFSILSIGKYIAITINNCRANKYKDTNNKTDEDMK